MQQRDQYHGNENVMYENIDAMRDPSEIIQNNFDQEIMLDKMEAQSAYSMS